MPKQLDGGAQCVQWSEAKPVVRVVARARYRAPGITRQAARGLYWTGGEFLQNWSPVQCDWARRGVGWLDRMVAELWVRRHGLKWALSA
jgi:hypothetical protein